jgi:hypothetical protein
MGDLPRWRNGLIVMGDQPRKKTRRSGRIVMGDLPKWKRPTQMEKGRVVVL